MYRKPRFLELLHEIREQMSRDADYDVELFAEMVRANQMPRSTSERNTRAFRGRPPQQSPRDGLQSDVRREADASRAKRNIS